jgi:hypothetical protein
LAYVRQHTTGVFVIYRWLLAGFLLWCLSNGWLTPLDTPGTNAHETATVTDSAATHALLLTR